MSGTTRLVCSCFERNTGSGKGPWKEFEDDGSALGSVTGTPFDPFGPSCFGMGRLANGRIWIAAAAYFFTCAADFTGVNPTPYPGDPETPGPFHYTGFGAGQGGSYLYSIGFRSGHGAQNYLIEIDPTDWSEVRSWALSPNSNYGFPNIGVTVGHTTAYWASQSGTTVRKMDLSTGIESNFLTGLPAGIGGVIVLPDDSVVIAHAAGAKRYSTAGAVLHTYASVTIYGGQGNLAHGVSGRNSFWLMGVATGAGRAHLYEFEADTEALLDDFELPDDGLRYEAPFAAIDAPVPPPPAGTIIVEKITVPGGSPDTFDFTASGGLSPATFSLVDGGSQTFSSVPVGSGYGIAESPFSSWITAIVVSNGSPANNISVADGETVTVTVTNTATVQPPNPSCRPIANLSTVAPNPGCNAGGVGWVPEYTGPSGVVPTVADPDPGEPLTGKRGVILDVAIEHTIYPGETTETLRYALVDLDDPNSRKEGRVHSIGDIEHGLSDNQGNLQAATIDVHLMDAQGRPIGSRMADPTRTYFARDELTVRARSDVGRRTNAAPRMVGRGLVTAESYGTPVVAELTAIDPLFAEGGAFGPDKKVPQWTFPWNYYSNGPQDITRLFMAIIFGEKSDERATNPLTGLTNARGLCPGRFVGLDGLGTGSGGSREEWGRFNACLFAIYKIIGLYGSDLGALGLYGRANATSNGASPSVITLGGSPDLSVVGTNETFQIVLTSPTAGIQKGIITAVDNGAKTVTVKETLLAADATDVNWYISSIHYEPRRVKIDLATRNGVDVMVPKWPNYIRPTVYEDFIGIDGDYRVTDFWVRGPLLDMHLSGECTLAFNAIGVEDKGDGSGLPITDYFTAFNFFVDNCLHRQLQRPFIVIAGQNYWPQTDGHLPQWSDGVTKTRQSTFAAAQARSAAQLGGAGLQVSAYFGDGISLRDAMQLWLDNGGCRDVIDEWGSLGVWTFDETADPTTWPRVEHVSRVFGDVRRWRALEEATNVIKGSCDWDADGQKFREPLEPILCPAAIRHAKGIQRASKHIDGKLLANKTHFQALLTQYARFQQDGPIYVRIDRGDIGLLDIPAGSGIQFTSEMGPGAAGLVAQPLIILRKILHVDERTVSLLCLDVSEQLIPLARQAVMTDDALTTAIMTDDPATTMVLT